jgi:hypothetical protein
MDLADATIRGRQADHEEADVVGRRRSDGANLPDPNILAQEIADDLRSALGQIEDILGDLERRTATTAKTSRDGADG